VIPPGKPFYSFSGDEKGSIAKRWFVEG